MTHPPQSPDPSQYGGGPASADFATEWGLKEHPERPKKVNQLTQLLWAYAAATVLNLVFAILASATAPWWYGTGHLTGAAVFGLIIGAFAIATAWFVTKDRLGVFGAQDPRTPLYIALGVLAFFALGGFTGGWTVGWYAALSTLLALAKLAAVGIAFYLLTRPEVAHWLQSRPGNRPKTPPRHPGGGHPQQQPPAQGHPQQPPGPAPQPPGQPPAQ
jgi:hypothetical protein